MDAIKKTCQQKIDALLIKKEKLQYKIEYYGEKIIKCESDIEESEKQIDEYRVVLKKLSD